MLRGLAPSELGLWAALWSIDPWGEGRADLRNALTASLIANVHRDAKARPSPFRPSEFMPFAESDAKAEAVDLSRRLRAAFITREKARP